MSDIPVTDTPPSIFVLDANVFISAKNSYYPFDIVPAFWNGLIRFSAEGRVHSIDRIKKQLEDGNDELADWIKAGNMAEAFANSGTSEVVKAYEEIVNWVQRNSQFTPPAKEAFATDPDGWLVAYVKASHGTVLVTQEVYKPGMKWKVPIPNICNAFGIKYTDTFAMLRELGFNLK